MDTGYIMLPRTCPLVVQPLRTSLLIVQLYGLPYSRDPSSYEPPYSQQSSSVSTEHTNLLAGLLTWEHH